MNNHIKLENFESFGQVYSQLITCQEMVETNLKSDAPQHVKACLAVLAEDLESLLEELALDFDYGHFATPFSTSFMDRSETVISETETILEACNSYILIARPQDIVRQTKPIKF